MYIALNWINELIDIQDIKLEKLIDKLTLGGFEVEDTLKVNVSNTQEIEIVLDISATANRADSLSIKGISKEIKALLNKKIKTSIYNYNHTDIEKKIQKTIDINTNYLDNSCKIFVAFTIENLDNFKSPSWIKDKLIASQIEPTDNFLDFQKYILLESGYPFEFYDLDKIKNITETNSFNLSLKPAPSNLSFIASNNIEYKLNSESLVLTANNYPLSISGIISNQTTLYDSNSKSLLIEAAIYKSKTIRQQSRSLGLRTDRSARYEKDLNDHHFIQAVIRLISLLRSSNPNLICHVHTTSKLYKQSISNIRLRYNTIKEVLGPITDNQRVFHKFLQPDQISEYLKRLDFIFQYDNLNLIWNIEIPESRIGDIEREIDIIEEIGRLHGFDNFLTSLPTINRIGLEDSSYKIRKKITNCLLNEGFTECIQYSLINDLSENAIKLINPLLKDCSTLRTSLLPNLLSLINQNINQDNSILYGFEFGHVFSGSIKNGYSEIEKVAGIFGGLKFKREWDETPKILSWFEAKGKIEDLFNKLNLKIYSSKYSLNYYQDFLHHYRIAEIKLINTNETVGIFGQINPILAKSYNISSDLFLFEFDINTLKNNLEQINVSLYSQYSQYPKITKDISFIVSQKISFDQIKTLLLNNRNIFLKNIELLDEYKGNFIPENHTSFCIQLVFQSDEKTLINKDIEEIIKNLQLLLEKNYNVILRG
jgi:phenylalanyl-tRNA synthetase beta chain